MSEIPKQESLAALRDIRSIMERSARFISLSGWSGIWAGCVALAGGALAYNWIYKYSSVYYYTKRHTSAEAYSQYTDVLFRFIGLAVVVLIIALAGGLYFTWRKSKRAGTKLWNNASRQMVLHMAIPLLAGGLFALVFFFRGDEIYVAPSFLVFYGLALINGSKYTLSDIKYLGLLELALGCANMFMPGYGLIFWMIGFGALHILYGIIMWNKYDKNGNKAE